MAATKSHSASPTSAPKVVEHSKTQAKRRKRRWWIAVIPVAVVAIMVGSIAYVTLPPEPPFHEAWSRSLVGNPFGSGAHEGNTFVTYVVQANPAEPPLQNVNVSAQAIDVGDGRTLWTSQPVTILDVGVFHPEVYVSGSNAYLLCTAASPDSGNLSVLALNLSTGSTVGFWRTPLFDWSSILPPSEQVALANSTMIVSYPVLFSNPTAFDVLGVNSLTGTLLWRTSVVINATCGWGTGSEAVFIQGSTVLFALDTACGPAGFTGAELLAINDSSGAVRFQRNLTGSSAPVSGVIDGGSFYFLDQSTGTVAIDGVNLSTGFNTSGFPIQRVANESLFSGALYTEGSLLIVVSESPSLNYMAYFTNGTEAWTLGFPLPCTFKFTLSQACSPYLSQPLSYGDGSELLLSSSSYFLSQGSSYHNAYRLVNVDNGTVVWSADYSFTFGTNWPWYGPVPTYTVESVVGFEIIYTIQTPGATTIAGGNL